MPFRIAASHYLNSAPLIWSLLKGSKRNLVDLIDAVPARCADLLRASQVDAALVPVIEYHRMPDVLFVPDVCVGSRKEVLSVVLVSKEPDLHKIRSVALDESSRTSVALVKIIFREFVGHEPSWTSRSPDLQAMLEQYDAALMIGDPAMTFPRDDLQVFDLARLWSQFTGLGFVFAMWMAQPAAADRMLRTIDFSEIRDEGLAQIEDIVDYYLDRVPLGRDRLRSYLTQNISYTVDETMQMGLELYFDLAARHGLIENVRPLLFTS